MRQQTVFRRPTSTVLDSHMFRFCHHFPKVPSIEPSISELVVEYSTTVLSLMPYNHTCLFLFDIFWVPSGSWIQTLDLRNKGWILYHCATTNGIMVPFFQVSSSGWIWTYNYIISGWVLFHYAITAGIPSTHVCFLQVLIGGLIWTTDLRMTCWVLS